MFFPKRCSDFSARCPCCYLGWRLIETKPAGQALAASAFRLQHPLMQSCFHLPAVSPFICGCGKKDYKSHPRHHCSRTTYISPLVDPEYHVPAGHLSSASRAKMNLVQNSWPEYREVYMTWARSGDAKITGNFAQINQEIDEINANPILGSLAILRRLASDPWKYVHWHVTKPALLWDWSIRIGEGDIYVYGTRNSPYELISAWRAVSAICYVIIPVILLLAAAGCILQVEPRYSIPYRGPEMLFGTFSVYWTWRKATYLSARFRPSTPA
jgi:hypothetical protein